MYMDFTVLTNAGIDVDDALKRFVGNGELFAKMLQKFTEEQSFCKLTQAVKNNDESGVLSAAHTLKGLCGMLSFTRLSELFSEQVALIRGGKYAQALELMPEISLNYNRIVRAIHACVDDTRLSAGEL